MDQSVTHWIGKAIMQELGIAKTQKPFPDVAVLVIGIGLVLSGIIGLFLPLLPGSALVMTGVLVLSVRSAWLRGKVGRWRPRLPLVGHARARLSAWCCALRTRVKNYVQNDSTDCGSRLGSKLSSRLTGYENTEETFDASPKVLIFDEDVKNLVWHAEPFETHGFEVYKCISIETAMRCVEREELDFAVVDQVSPAFEGLRVIRHLMRYNLRTPFVVLARCKNVECNEQAVTLGAMDYLEKPVPRAQMNWLIRHHFGIAPPRLLCPL